MYVPVQPTTFADLFISFGSDRSCEFATLFSSSSTRTYISFSTSPFPFAGV